MKPNVPLHNFSHQTIQRPATSGHELQHTSAFLLRFECALDGVDLPPDTSDATSVVFPYLWLCEPWSDYTIR